MHITFYKTEICLVIIFFLKLKKINLLLFVIFYFWKGHNSLIKRSFFYLFFWLLYRFICSKFNNFVSRKVSKSPRFDKTSLSWGNAWGFHDQVAFTSALAGDLNPMRPGKNYVSLCDWDSWSPQMPKSLEFFKHKYVYSKSKGIYIKLFILLWRP